MGAAEGSMQNNFSSKMWNEIKQTVQSAAATAYPLDVTAEAKRIARANSGENVALEDIVESLVRLALPARVVLFFSERSGKGLALRGDVLSAASNAELGAD
jgi:hypothetical protein